METVTRSHLAFSSYNPCMGRGRRLGTSQGSNPRHFSSKLSKHTAS